MALTPHLQVTSGMEPRRFNPGCEWGRGVCRCQGLGIAEWDPPRMPALTWNSNPNTVNKPRMLFLKSSNQSYLGVNVLAGGVLKIVFMRGINIVFLPCSYCTVTFVVHLSLVNYGTLQWPYF